VSKRRARRGRHKEVQELNITAFMNLMVVLMGHPVQRDSQHDKLISLLLLQRVQGGDLVEGGVRGGSEGV